MDLMQISSNLLFNLSFCVYSGGDESLACVPKEEMGNSDRAEEDHEETQAYG